MRDQLFKMYVFCDKKNLVLGKKKLIVLVRADLLTGHRKKMGVVKIL